MWYGQTCFQHSLPVFVNLVLPCGGEMVEPSNDTFFPPDTLSSDQTAQHTPSLRAHRNFPSNLVLLLGFTTEASWPCLRDKQNQCESVTHEKHSPLDVERTTPAPRNKRAQTQRICGPENLRTRMLRVSHMEAATQQFKTCSHVQSVVTDQNTK